MSIFGWLFGTAQKSKTYRNLEPLHLAPGLAFDFEVIGEFQRVLDDLCGGRRESGYDLQVTAQLCFLDKDCFDPNAVGVFISQRIVGYIPQHLAPKLRSELLRLNPKERPVSCDAKVVGGWDQQDRGEGHYYAVKLSLAQPLRLRA